MRLTLDVESTFTGNELDLIIKRKSPTQKGWGFFLAEKCTRTDNYQSILPTAI